MNDFKKQNDPATIREAEEVRAKLAEIEARHAQASPPGYSRDQQEAEEGAVQAPRPMELGGKIYLISKPMPADLVAIRHYMLTKAPSALQQLASDPALQMLPLPLQMEAIREATRAQSSGGTDLSQEGALKIMLSPAGVAFNVWLLARREHPTLTVADLLKDITEANCHEVNVKLTEATAVSALAKNSTGQPSS